MSTTQPTPPPPDVHMADVSACRAVRLAVHSGPSGQPERVTVAVATRAPWSAEFTTAALAGRLTLRPGDVRPLRDELSRLLRAQLRTTKRAAARAEEG